MIVSINEERWYFEMKKRMIGMLLAGAMVLGMAAPVFADEVETVTMLTYVDWGWSSGIGRLY